METNQLKMIVFCCFAIFITCCAASQYEQNQSLFQKEYDICNPGDFYTKPPLAILPDSGDVREVYVNWSADVRRRGNCQMLFKTCAHCHLHISFMGGKWSFASPLRPTVDGTCKPDVSYFNVYDVDYRNFSKATLRFSQDEYTSESRFVHVMACMNRSVDKLGTRSTLHIYSIEKSQIIDGNLISQPNFITSPFFPAVCKQNGETYTYDIESTWDSVNAITVSFDDWLVSPSSEFSFSNNIRRMRYSGTRSRPFIKLEGSTASVKFYTGTYMIPGTYMSFRGFKAKINYYREWSDIQDIKMGCDRVIENTGGLLQPNAAIVDGEYRDCIWLIKTPPGKDGILISHMELAKNIDKKSTFSLKVVSGLTSVGTHMKEVIASNYYKRKFDHQMDSPDGFYVRVKGRFYHGYALSITYASYSYDPECSRKNAFLCDNQRCIDISLRCDGYDHCGDNSDEASSICKTTVTERSSSFGVGVIVPVFVCLLVIIIFCTFLIFLKRCRNVAFVRRTSSSRNRSQRLSRQSIQIGVTVNSENPPPYSEVMNSGQAGSVNMAFSWTSSSEAGALPPSYEEAVQAVNFDLSTSISTSETALPIRTSNTATQSQNNIASLPISVISSGHLTQAFSSVSGYAGQNTAVVPSLDPRAYVSSSSSSSEDGDRRGNLESASSDSSSENDSLFNPVSATATSNSCSMTAPAEDSSSVDNTRSMTRKNEGKAGGARARSIVHGQTANNNEADRSNNREGANTRERRRRGNERSVNVRADPNGERRGVDLENSSVPRRGVCQENGEYEQPMTSVRPRRRIDQGEQNGVETSQSYIGPSPLLVANYSVQSGIRGGNSSSPLTSVTFKTAENETTVV